MLLEQDTRVESAQLDSTTVLYDPREERYLVLERPAALAWRALGTPMSEDGVLAVVSPQLDLPEAEARAAVSDALEDLRALGVLCAPPTRAAAPLRHARVLSSAAFAMAFAAVLASIGSGAALAQSYGGGDPV